MGSFYSPVEEPGRFTPPPPIFPTVRIVPPAATSGDSDSATPGTEALPPEVIDPEFQPVRTVYEAPTATRTRETDWDWVYNRYVELNYPVEVEQDVPFHREIIDWGVDVFSGVMGGILDPAGIGQAIQTAYSPSWLTTPGVTGVPSLGQQQGLAAPAITPGGAMPAGCPPVGPKYAKICLATREITPLRRRRRRRLLTSSDIKDLAALKAIVGGAALQGAVVQAIRR